jgi:uncharacterized protein (DUF1778 family)
MTLELQLSSEAEAKIREQAAAAGQDIAAFVLQAVTEKLADTESHAVSPTQNDNNWHEQLRALIDLHPVVTHFVDDSRESIYAGRGE